ncbi:MAG TPA: prolyl aminopeptidase [Rhodospirillaceae bacterium]|nr:prolyl aminopeptidase [Rhodospirillaceae bacterium]
MALRKFYPEIEPYSSGHLKVDDIHTLYWEQSGNPDGVPIVFLHGGPGGGISPSHRRFFDPDHYRIVLFDQRGSGKSEPAGEIKNNTPDLLVEDIETLRHHLKIDKWHIFGGSWGSTLALLYAIKHADRCISMILRGIFLMEEKELDWFAHGIKTIFPEEWERFAGFLNPNERKDIVSSYYKRLIDEDPHVHMPAARVWSQYESACAMMFPEAIKPYDPAKDLHHLCISRIEAHYFLHHKIAPEDSLLNHIDKIKHIPATIIQGRYDMICPIETAHRLHKAWPEADYIIVPDGGHSAADPSIRDRLLAATDNHRSINT